MANKSKKTITNTIAEIRKDPIQFAKDNPELVASVALGVTVTATALISWWRAHNDALRAKGWANEYDSALAFRIWSDVYLLKFNRALTAASVMSEAKWIEDKYQNLEPHSVVERTWPRYLFLKSYIQILDQNFPPYLAFEKYRKFMNESQLVLGIDGFKRPVLINTQSRIGMILVGGKSGTGKTSLVYAIVRQYPKDNVQVIAGKRGSYPQIAHTSADELNEETADAILATLTGIESEIKRRYQVLADHGVDSVARAPKEIQQQMPRLLTIAEEADSWLRLSGYPKDLKQKAEGIIAKVRFLAKQGRGANHLLVVVNQSLQKGELDINPREGGVIVSSQTDTADMSRALYGSDVAFSKSLVNGVFVIEDEKGVRRIKCLSPDDQKHLGKKWWQVWRVIK